ncbi:MAG: DUF1552 domain-containing protein [Rhodospirillaceae bacterium]|nr:DUF1552 domain-containing protein [Rhodospirillaceae bacterium]
MSASERIATRRRVLKGMMGGAAVTVGLPLLDCFLNTNGTAMAATGASVPNVFGTWFWGCGLTPGRWEPSKVGANFDIKPEIAPLEPYKKHLNVYSGMKAYLDGKPPRPHSSGRQAAFSGDVPADGKELASIDSLISDVIGGRTRFRSLEVACTGNPRDTVSRRSATVANSSEGSAARFYARVFGPEFKDPNSADFKPDPRALAEKSALTAVKEERIALMNQLGASDKQRLDEYFTSLRELEKRLELELVKPAPVAACSTPKDPGKTAGENGKYYSGVDIDGVIENNKLFSQIMAYALACDQTRVFNISFSDAQSSLRKAGDTTTHHILTHEEAIDEKLGYQPRATWFTTVIMAGLAETVKHLASIREGDKTLLDRTLLFASSDGGFAKIHSTENIPMFTVGGAGGRIKTGMHIQAKGDAVTRVGLTLQQVMGVSASSWGTMSMQTSKPFSEIIA